jgi:hypothetical protein
MFPGFVYIYKDKSKFVHLFFFKGIDDEYKPIYRDLDLSKIPFSYSEKVLNEYTSDYVFINKSIIKITCKLVPTDLINNSIHEKILMLYK